MNMIRRISRRKISIAKIETNWVTNIVIENVSKDENFDDESESAPNHELLKNFDDCKNSNRTNSYKLSIWY